MNIELNPGIYRDVNIFVKGPAEDVQVAIRSRVNASLCMRVVM